MRQEKSVRAMKIIILKWSVTCYKTALFGSRIFLEHLFSRSNMSTRVWSEIFLAPARAYPGDKNPRGGSENPNVNLC
jgi:hypothetical protein